MADNDTLKLSNINELAQSAASVVDGDYIYIYKAGSDAFSKIERSVFMQGIAGGLSPSDIINSLDSDRTDKALSAAQGKELAGMIRDIETSGVVTDSSPTPNSTKPVQSGGVYNALQRKQDTISDLASIRSKANSALQEHQHIKTINNESLIGDGNITISGGGSINIDENPSSGSSNAVSSGGVYSALAEKQNKLVSGTNIKSINNTNILSSGNITVPEADAAGHIEYDIIPRAVLDGVNIPSSQVLSYRTEANIGKSFHFNDGKIRTIYRASSNTPQICIASDQDLTGTIFYNNADSKFYKASNTSMAAISTGSGSGGSAQIDVVDDGASVPSGSDICFFADSPSQAVGKFNSLLQNGEDDGTSYSPRNLYSIDSRVNYEIDSDTSAITAVNNMVHYNGIATALRNRGDVVVSNMVKMADTCDTAYISFIVARPFYTSTNVRITFPYKDVSVYVLNGNKVWTSINSGYVWSFTPYGNATKIILAVKRVDSDYANTLDTTIGLYNGYETKKVHVIFNPTRVYFKDGAGYNGFDPTKTITLSDVDSALRSSWANISYTSGNDYITIGGTQNGIFCPLVKNVSFDMSKFNVFYAVVTQRSNTWLNCATFLDGWGGVVPGRSESDVLYNAFNLSSHCSDSTVRNNEVDDDIAKLGSYIMRAFVHNMRVGDTKSLNLYFAKNKSSSMRVKEFGVITYDNNF